MHVHCQYHKICLSFNIAEIGKLIYVYMPSIISVTYIVQCNDFAIIKHI